MVTLKKKRVKALFVVVSLGLTSLLGSAAIPTVASSADMKNVKIAFLLPQNGVPRFEQLDKPYFEKQIKKLCPTCTVLHYNAQNEDAAKQQQQAEAALAAGAKILVLCPVDGKAAKVIADLAAKKGVPVVAYERLVMGSKNVKAYVTHDGVEIGKMQALSLMAGTKALGISDKPVLMVHGSITTSDAALFKKGAQDAFKAAGVKILAEFDTPGWDPAKAQAQMDQWITQYGKDGFGAVYAANGGTAGGIIASMKAAGIPASISLSAGTFVCNHIFYVLQDYLKDSPIKSGFMHVPLMDEQRKEFPNLPTMPVRQMVAGVQISLDLLRVETT